MAAMVLDNCHATRWAAVAVWSASFGCKNYKTHISALETGFKSDEQRKSLCSSNQEDVITSGHHNLLLEILSIFYK